MSDSHDPTAEDLYYARATADRFAGGDRNHTAIMAAQLMAANLDGIDGQHPSVDDFRIRRARAFSRIWQEQTERAGQRGPA